MSLYKLFSSFTKETPAQTEELPKIKESRLPNLLSPALKVFTKVSEGEPPITIDSLTRLTDVEKKELLKHSILHTKNPQKKAIKPGAHMTPLLGQIHADALAVNNSLEQLPSHEGAKAWAALLREVEEVDTTQELQKMLTQYEKTSSDLSCIRSDKNKAIPWGQKVAESIYKLEIGESFLLEGGRKKGSIDCPIVFEFIRVSESAFDLFVYLPGKEEGLYREQVVEDGKKTWNRSCIHYQNIPGNTHLFFGESSSIKSDFFQTILESRFHDQEMTPQYVTLHLLGHLQSYRNNLDPMTSGRRASTDVWSSLKPVVLRKLGRENYKKVMFEIKLNSLIQGYQQGVAIFENDTPESDKLRIVLRRGAQLILKSLASFHNTKIAISDHLFTRARATAIDLLDELNRVEKSISQKRRTHSHVFSTPLINQSTLQTTYSKALETAKKSVKEPSPNRSSIDSTRARLIDLPSSERFPEVIEQFVNAYGSVVLVNSIRSAEIEHLVSLMPIPNSDENSFWNKIPQDRLMSTLSALDKMTDIYAKAIHAKNKGVTSKEANIAYALFAIIHHLTLAYDRSVQKEVDASHPASLAHYPIYFPGLETDEDPYLLFTSPEDYARREELIAYFKNSYVKTKEYTSEELFNLKKDISYSTYGGREDPTSLIAYLLALTEDERFQDQLSASALTAEDHNSSGTHKALTQMALGLTPEKVKKGMLAAKLVRCLAKPDRYPEDYQFLSEKGFGHLLILARSAIISHHFTESKNSLDNISSLHAYFNPSHPTLGPPTNYTLTISFRTYYSRSVESSALHPTLRQDQKKLFEKAWIKRDKSTNTSKQEAEVLAQVNPNQGETTDEIAFLRSSCEPSLFPYKLLSYYRGKLDLFESFQEQALFEIVFFRSVALEPDVVSHDSVPTPYQRIRFFALADEMKQKGLQEQAKLFIQEGLDRYFFRQPNQKPKVLAATLFLRLACRLSRFLDGSPLVDSVDLIEKMMAVPSISQEERSLLSIHQVLAYSTLKRELTQEEVDKVFGAWVYFKNTPFPEEWRNLLLEREAETFVHQTSASLSTSQNLTFQRSILKSALKQLGVELPSSFVVSAKEPHLIEGRGTGSDFWTVNILTGQVMSADGILRRTTAPNDLQDNTFTYIFGNLKPSYFETQGCYYFSHPTLGTFRAVKLSNSYWNKTFYIQKQVGHEWYQYVPPETYLKSIPRFLCGNYTHWVNTNTYRTDMIICTRDTGQVVATINQMGLIQSKDQTETYWGVDDTTFLANFERPEYMHWSINKQGKKTLTLWRYQSHAHTPLSFEVENNTLVFTANRKYTLSKEQKPGLLGAHNGSLVLVNKETGEEKVLVAFKPLKEHIPLSTQHEIDVKDHHVSYDSLGEYYMNQKNRFEFLEFDVKNSSLVPLTQEGILYLAYQNLAQRRYEEAFYRLKQIDFRDQLVENSQHTLTKIVTIANTTDTSPDASAVALHAWVLFQKAARRMHAEDKPFGSPPNCAEICGVYSRFEHQIPENLLLNDEDQRLCGLKSPKKFVMHHYPEIQAFLPSPERSQQAITHINIPYADVIFGSQDHLPNFNSKWQWARLIEEAKKALEEATAFIPMEHVPSNFNHTHLLIDSWTPEFEKGFFSTAYEIARKKQGTEYDRKLLAFRMQAISESQTKPESWKYLQLAFKYPEEAPDLPDPKNHKARLDFVNRCADLYDQKLELEPISTIPSKASTSLHSSEEPQRPLTAPLFPSRKVEEVSSPLELAPFSKEVIDGNVTQQLFTHYFKKKDEAQNLKIGAPNCPEVSAFEEEEKEFLKILETEFKEFAEDYKKGAEINADRKFYDLEKPAELREKLQHEIKTLNGQLVNLESSILELANKHDPDKWKTTLYKEAKIEQELSLKRLADLFLQGDAEAFAKANPYLRDPALIDQIASSYGLNADNNLVIVYLYNQIGLYMTLFTHKARLERSVKLCKEIEPLKASDLKRDALVQKLADELKPLDKAVYSIKEYPAFLVFEYLSGLSIRPQQADLLAKLLECKDGKYINRVIQLIMGGGKTSVMAVILLKLAAKKGRLSLFVTPASQYASVSYNLRKTLRDCFGIDMEEIDVTREQLAKSSTMCEEILARLQNAVNAGNFLLIKAETLQTIGLEFLDFVYQVAKDPEPSAELMKKINVLKEILLIFKERGDALFDEVDLLLNVLQEVNFPVGEMEFIATERIEVIRELFVLFTSEKVAISDTEAVNLHNLIGLRANRQNLLSLKQWKDVVIKAVAYNLPRTMESLKLQGRLDFCESFERYMNGTMNVKCQELLDHPNEEESKKLNDKDALDFQFLTYVKSLRHSKDPAEQEGSHHIALIKHMMQSVLPVTFEKTGKRNYGRGGSLPGEVRPYLAVDTPSENLFGYHWEAISYHFQTALQSGISREQMLHIAKVYKEQAEIQSDREKIVFDKTMEAIEFKDLTGIALHELDHPEKVDQAIINLNQNIDALLRFEADTAATYVSYYPMRLTSTGQSLVNMLCTVRAMSGTPWNTPCYPSSLSDNFEPAVGTEGQIAEALLSRAAQEKKEKKHVHVIRSHEITEILKELLDKHPQKQRVRILMDSGALFKNYSNLEVATAIRDYLGIPVLFFMRNPHKKEKTPDTLAVLKVGSNTPDIIGGTRLEDIQKTGLNLQDYFVFDDERHTTGTDIPLIPDAIGLMTMDEEMLRRSLFQTIMRERDFFLNQEVEFILPEHLLTMLKKLTPQMETKNEDLKYLLENLILSIKNQAIAKSKHYYRSCKQKIDAIFRQNLLAEFLIEQPLTADFVKNQFPAYKKTTLTVQSDSPYDQFGALEYPVDSQKALEAYRQRKLNQFPKEHPQRATIEAKTQEILDEAKKSPYAPGTVLEAGSHDIGMQVDVLTEVAAEVNVETDQDVDQEVLRELEVYQNVQIGRLMHEKEWSDREMEGFLKDVRKNNETQIRLRPLSECASSAHFPYLKDYEKVFSSGIRVTESWMFTTDRALPVFHKMQRPLEQLLIVKSKAGYHAIALSQKEAKQFKNFLNKNQTKEFHKNVWLIQADGNSFQDNPISGSLPIKEASIQAFLIECNVFNGRIDYLDSHEEYASVWLHEDAEQQVNIKKNFLKLKVAHNKLQKRLFFKSEIFGDARSKENQRKYRWKLMAEEMEGLSKEQIQAFGESDAHKLKWLPPKQLNMLKADQVKLLKGDPVAYLVEPTLIQAIPQKYASHMLPSQLKSIAPEQVPWFKGSVTKTQAIPGEYCKHMEDEQIKLISPSQVTQIKEKDTLVRLSKLNPSLLAAVSEEQVKNDLIDASIVPHLRKKEAIQALPVKWLEHVEKSLRQKYLIRPQVADLPTKPGKLIHDLTEDQVKWLSKEEQLLKLEDSQIGWIIPSQITDLIKSSDLVKKLVTVAQFKALDPALYVHLEKAQIEQLGKGELEILQALFQHSDKQKLLSAEQKKWIPKNSSKTPPISIDIPQPTIPSSPPSSTRSELVVDVPTKPVSSEEGELIEVQGKRSITQIVLCTLALLVATGVAVAGAFALMGALWPQAPQFTMVVYHAFQSPLFMPFVAAGGGTILLVGLSAYAINLCRKPKKSHIVVKKEALID